MAILSTQPVTRAGLAPTFAAAAGGGDRFTPDSKVFLHIKNASGASITATIVTPRNDALGNPIADNAIAIPAAGERMIGPFPAEHYGSTTDGLADVSYSATASVTVGAFALG